MDNKRKRDDMKDNYLTPKSLQWEEDETKSLGWIKISRLVGGRNDVLMSEASVTSSVGGVNVSVQTDAFFSLLIEC